MKAKHLVVPTQHNRLSQLPNQTTSPQPNLSNY
nr:MAG TPA_asm: hypothetical protein [Caudoviricetes sp.]